MDAERIPKDGYFANQVMWDGWVDVERPRTHIIGHWNYQPGTSKDVYVVSSAEKVELFLNDKSLGFGTQSNRFLFTFKNVAWQPGVLRAVGFDATGRKTTEASAQTAGAPAAIRLTPRTGPKGLKADGADLALIDVEVVDAMGRRCPVALNMIDFALSGPAEWRGGIAQGPDNYVLAKSLPVEGGINRIIIRSTTRSGRINLTARSAGLSVASVQLFSRPVKVTNGLSSTMPDEDLHPQFERGPTPPAEELRLTRMPIVIAGAVAPINNEKTRASFDDNEVTAWSSDGQLQNGWIKYDLAQPANINEVTIKFGGWRTRTYPITISVDDRVVFTGQTNRSLGYVTISFEPVLGQSLKIQMTADPSDDTAANATELNQKTPEAIAATRKLEIVEIEIYEPVRKQGTAAGRN